jgi:AraC-like DNA-binding protein
MKYHEYAAHSILQDIVKCFWILEADHASESIQEVVPDGCVELIFNFGRPYELLTPTKSYTLPIASVVGFQNTTLQFRVKGTVKVVAARLFAWGAVAILGEDIRRFTHEVRAAGAGWDKLIQNLESQVRQEQYPEAATTLQEYFIESALLRTYPLKHIQAAAKLLHYTKGQHRIDELADYCHMSVRQLERGFQQVVGISPKALARTLRFDRAKTRLMFDPDADLTRLAQDCGYFDQAHFIKDFRSFAGKTPTEFVQQLREFREYLKSKDVVFLQSESEQADYSPDRSDNS